jgi:hypothetical protein
MGQAGVDQFGQGMFGGGGAGNFYQDETMFGGGGGQAKGVFGVGMHQGHVVIGDQFGGGKGSKRQSLMLMFSPCPLLPPGFLEMKTPAVWYHKQKDRVARNSPQQKLMELGGAVRRTDGGSRTGGSPFFNSPPVMGGERITLIRFR